MAIALKLHEQTLHVSKVFTQNIHSYSRNIYTEFSDVQGYQQLLAIRNQSATQMLNTRGSADNFQWAVQLTM